MRHRTAKGWAWVGRNLFAAGAAWAGLPHFLMAGGFRGGFRRRLMVTGARSD